MTDEIIISAVGDVWFGDHPVTLGHGINSTIKKEGFSWPFQKVASLLQNADIIFCNLESVLSDKGLKKYYLPSIEMRGFPECVKSLKTANFSLVNIANNHMMQHGTGAFLDTISLLKSNKIDVVGIDENKKTIPFRYEKNDMQVSFLGFSLHPEEYSHSWPLYSYRKSEEEILGEVAEFRASFDGIIVLSLHWGKEFVDYPSREQVQLAHKLIDSGVSIILGHHPHVLQGIEQYKNGLIAYSLGNFLFDLWTEKTKISMILKIFINSKGIKKYEIIPIFAKENFQPAVAYGDKEREITQHLYNLNGLIKDKSFNLRGNDYQKVVDTASKKFRNESYKYFIRKIFHYSPNIIIQSILRTLHRKIRT